MWDYILKQQELIIYILIVTAVAVISVRVMRMLISRFINSRQDATGIDPTKFKFIKNSLSAVIFVLALVLILYRLPGGEAIAVSIFASAGIIAAIVGFASQAAFSNIVSGIFIVIFKPFRYGDLLQIGTDQRCVVEDITLRHTVIRNLLNQRIIVPNSIISDATVINFTIIDAKAMRQLDFSVAYNADIDKAKRIIREVIEAHPKCIDNRNEEQIAADAPIVDVRLVALGEYSVQLKANAWGLTFGDTWDIFTDANEAILKRFAEEGIEIPYPHRVVISQNQSVSG